MLRRVALCVFLAASGAQAGPWPETTDGTFISLIEDFGDGTSRGTTSIFVESGGSENFTIGLDTEIGETDDDWSAYAFIRQPLTSAGARDRVAVSAGLGALQTSDGTEPVVVVGGAWGRDVTSDGGGWLSLEGEARYLTESGDTELVGDATVAVEAIDRIALVNQLSVTGIPGSDTAAETLFTTSVVGSISENARIELGATVDLSGASSTGLRVGTWLEF